MHQVFPYDLGKVFLLNLTFFLHIPQHKYSVVLIRLLIIFLFFGGCRSVTIAGLEINFFVREPAGD